MPTVGLRSTAVELNRIGVARRLIRLNVDAYVAVRSMYIVVSERLLVQGDGAGPVHVVLVLSGAQDALDQQHQQNKKHGQKRKLPELIAPALVDHERVGQVVALRMVRADRSDRVLVAGDQVDLLLQAVRVVLVLALLVQALALEWGGRRGSLADRPRMAPDFAKGRSPGRIRKCSSFRRSSCPRIFVGSSSTRLFAARTRF